MNRTKEISRKFNEMLFPNAGEYIIDPVIDQTGGFLKGITLPLFCLGNLSWQDSHPPPQARFIADKYFTALSRHGLNSERGGIVKVRVTNDRVYLGGQALLY